MGYYGFGNEIDDLFVFWWINDYIERVIWLKYYSGRYWGEWFFFGSWIIGNWLIIFFWIKGKVC